MADGIGNEGAGGGRADWPPPTGFPALPPPPGAPAPPTSETNPPPPSAPLPPPPSSSDGGRPSWLIPLAAVFAAFLLLLGIGAVSASSADKNDTTPATLVGTEVSTTVKPTTTTRLPPTTTTAAPTTTVAPTTTAAPPTVPPTTAAPSAVAPPPPPASDCPNGTYVNSAGNSVCRPYESAGPPAGATAKCNDGTYSFSQSRRGTCSGHGGVAVWL